MKKFIEALEKQGIMDNLVDSVKRTNEMVGNGEAPVSAIAMILNVEMMRNEELFDLFVDDAEKIGFKQVTEYVNSKVQEVEATEKLMEQGSEFIDQMKKSDHKKEEPKPIEEKIEDVMLDHFGTFLDNMFGQVLNQIINSDKDNK